MNNNNQPKNPISFINEFCLRTSSKVSFEFDYIDQLFTAKVIYNRQILGEGKDKKKQNAKFKAAEMAVERIKQMEAPKESLEIALEKELSAILTKLGRRGQYKLSFKDPLFVYQYFIAEDLIAEGKCVTEPLAKIKCMKKVVKSLRPIVDKKEDPDEKSSPHEKVEIYLTKKLGSFQMNSQEKSFIFKMEEIMKNLENILGIELIPLGSYYLNITRNNKLDLDFCIICENLSESFIFSIFKSIEQNLLSFSEKSTSFPKITPVVMKNDSQFYNKLPYIRLIYKSSLTNIYFYDSPKHPSLLHYSSLSKNPAFDLSVSTFLRYWKHKKQLPLPVEILDLISCFKSPSILQSLRQALELLTTGSFLPIFSTLPGEYLDIIKAWPVSCQYEVACEAVLFIFSLCPSNIVSYIN